MNPTKQEQSQYERDFDRVANKARAEKSITNDPELRRFYNSIVWAHNKIRTLRAKLGEDWTDPGEDKWVSVDDQRDNADRVYNEIRNLVDDMIK